MINKKGIFKSIFLIIVLFLLVAGVLIYYQIKTKGVQLTTGDIIVDIKFNNSDPNDTISLPGSITGNSVKEDINTSNYTVSFNVSEDGK